jgi:hypothetical protein
MKHYQVHRHSIKRKRRLVKYFAQSLKSEGCVICGYNRCYEALHFHHTSEEKDRNISRARSMEMIESEVEKCVVVCANCHAEIHAGLVGGMDLPKTGMLGVDTEQLHMFH